MKKRLAIFPEKKIKNLQSKVEEEFSHSFNSFNRKYRIYYETDLDSIKDFIDNKSELITNKVESLSPFYITFELYAFDYIGGTIEKNQIIINKLSNVMVKSIENINSIKKKIEIFDLLGDLSLFVYLKRKDYRLRELVMDDKSKENFNKIQTLDEVEITFLYYNDNQILLSIDKNNKETIQKTPKPQYNDLVLV